MFGGCGLRTILTFTMVVATVALVGSPRPRASSAHTVAPDGSDVFTKTATLSAADGTRDAFFGAAVAASVDTVVVGAPGRAAAYVFVRPDVGWNGPKTEDAMLVPSQLNDEDKFGWTVAIWGDTVIVSADSTTDHFAYVFVKPESGWSGVITESASLKRSDGSRLLPLGRWLAISDDTVVMAGLLSDTAGAQAPNTAYVFVRPAGGWAGTVSESAKLMPTQLSAKTWITAVDISRDTVVVGAYLDEVVPRQRYGSAYVFVKPTDGWAGIINERARLIAPDDGPMDEYPFGASVALNDETVVIGSDFDMMNEYGRGTAYIFRRPVAGWSGLLTPHARIEASGDKRAEQALDPRQRDVRSFGYTLAVAGDTIVAGSWKGAYIFVEPVEGWSGVLTEDQTLSEPTGVTATPVDILALSDDLLVIGAPEADLGRFRRQGVAPATSGNPGVVYVYRRQSR